MQPLTYIYHTFYYGRLIPPVGHYGEFMLLPGKKIITTSSDDFLYKELTDLLNEIKLAQGGTALDSTLHRHNMLRIYLISKQIDKIKTYETKYFNSDGTLKSLHNS